MTFSGKFRLRVVRYESYTRTLISETIDRGISCALVKDVQNDVAGFHADYRVLVDLTPWRRHIREYLIETRFSSRLLLDFNCSDDERFERNVGYLGNASPSFWDNGFGACDYFNRKLMTMRSVSDWMRFSLKTGLTEESLADEFMYNIANKFIEGALSFAELLEKRYGSGRAHPDRDDF